MEVTMEATFGNNTYLSLFSIAFSEVSFKAVYIWKANYKHICVPLGREPWYQKQI